MTSVLHTAARPETLLSREREELAFPDPSLPDGLHPLFASILAERGWEGGGGGRGGVWMLVRDPCAFTDQCKLSDQQCGPASLDDRTPTAAAANMKCRECEVVFIPVIIQGAACS